MMLKNRRAGIIVGIAAAAVLTAVLLLVTIGAPEDNGEPEVKVMALVNGAAITEEDVYRKQIEYYWVHRRNLSEEDALHLLIVRKAVYQEGVKQGYEITPLIAERRLLREWGLTADQLRAEADMAGVSYEEFLEQERVRMVIEDFTDALFGAIRVSEEEARQFYEELKEEGEELEPFEEMKEELIIFLRYEQWLEQIDDIANQAEVEYL